MSKCFSETAVVAGAACRLPFHTIDGAAGRKDGI
jgi:hypothetical protein